MVGSVSVAVLVMACAPSENVRDRTVPPEVTPAAVVTRSSEAAGSKGMTAPPPVVVRGGSTELSLGAFTYCHRTGCVDGRPMDLPDLGTVTGDVTVSFPLGDWTFVATQLQPAVVRSTPCDVRLPARVVPTGAGRWRLEPAGPPGRYRIDLFGRAPGGGDLLVAFALTTSAPGPMPDPRVSLSAFYDHDGTPDNYGTFELGINHLRTTPREAGARLTILGQDGRSTYELPRGVSECRPRGEVRFRAEVPNESVLRAVGQAPYTIRVDLELDGKRHSASVVWPRDVSKDPDGDESLVPIFSPALR
ncbi:hypothetical protein [Streptosporangium subroseum]|uniref:hypothetical protein n=1 Tax=Streptosporangium subroseum TaxID=106412 RepID=UPI00308EFEBF|nr:hypothetical protein OHB15_00775 [Streptosporangium subroseum]